jgi:hypothetical protein
VPPPYDRGQVRRAACAARCSKHTANGAQLYRQKLEADIVRHDRVEDEALDRRGVGDCVSLADERPVRDAVQRPRAGPERWRKRSMSATTSSVPKKARLAPSVRAHARTAAAGGG